MILHMLQVKAVGMTMGLMVIIMLTTTATQITSALIHTLVIIKNMIAVNLIISALTIILKQSQVLKTIKIRISSTTIVTPILNFHTIILKLSLNMITAILITFAPLQKRKENQNMTSVIKIINAPIKNLK